MPMTYPTISELVSKMNSYPSTCGWDVVCSYNVKQLNEFLQAQYDQDKLAKDVPIKVDIPNPMGPEFPGFERTYQLKLASPILSFNKITGFATLTMQLQEGSTSTTNPVGDDQHKKTVQIPGGIYSIQAVVPLAAVKGGEDPTPENPKGPHEIIEFHEKVVHDYHVIIHFKNEKGTSYDIISNLNQEDDKHKDDLITNLLPPLKTYFMTKVKEIDYTLSTINNAVPTHGEVVLTPKSFAFSSLGIEEDGVLSLYIQTTESGNPPGSEFPAFQPGGQPVYPIPADYSASLILSNALVKKLFIEAPLVKSGYEVRFLDQVGVITAELKKDVSVIVADQSHKSYSGNDSYEGLNISFATYPITLTLVGGKISLSWKGETCSEWYSHTTGSDISQYGRVYLTLSVEKGPIEMNFSDNDVISADVAISSADFKIETRAGSCDFWDKASGCSEYVPRFYKSEMQLIPPAIHLTFTGLNFFNTTNLLAPGKHMIDFDRKEGLKSPYDLLLIGNLVKEGTALREG